MKQSTQYDKVIKKLFADRWTENLANADIVEQRAQVYKTLHNQVDGFWSGHTAYNLVVDAGFLINSKSGSKKRLTLLGEDFMNTCNPRWKSTLKKEKF